VSKELLKHIDEIVKKIPVHRTKNHFAKIQENLDKHLEE